MADDPIRLIIDTDTAGDDVVSLLIGLLHPRLRLEAITLCAGNVEFGQQVENALYTVERAGRGGEVPVYVGCGRPLVGPWISADYVHGKDGMGNSHFPRARQRQERQHAVEALVERINAAPGELTILAQAPLTNIAMAVMRDPSIAGKVKALYVMGGSYLAPGNITAAAEYNFYIDPEAARIVFEAGFPLYMVGWEVAVRHGVFDDRDLKEIGGLGTDLAQFFLDVNRGVRAFNETVGLAGTTHPDSIVCAMIVDPGIATGWRRCWVTVETRGEFTRGMSVVDPRQMPGREGWDEHRPNAWVCEGADKVRFKSLLAEILRTR